MRPPFGGPSDVVLAGAGTAPSRENQRVTRHASRVTRIEYVKCRHLRAGWNLRGAYEATRRVYLGHAPPAPSGPVRERSRRRLEDMGDVAAAERGGAHRLEVQRCGEQPHASAQHDWVNDEAVLVDEAGLDERSGESDAGLREQVSAGVLLLEPRDGGGQLSGRDRRLGPVGRRE